MEIKNLNLYEDFRNILLQTGRLEESIKEIEHKRLNESLLEMLHTCQADLLVTMDFVSEVENCTSDLEIDDLLECFPQDETVN